MLVKQVKMFPMGKHNNYTDKINGFLKNMTRKKYWILNIIL